MGGEEGELGADVELGGAPKDGVDDVVGDLDHAAGELVGGEPSGWRASLSRSTAAPTWSSRLWRWAM
jgi:hypothetical protein